MSLKLNILAISAMSASCLLGQDPFENSPTVVVESSDGRSSTPSGWRTAFGVSKWTLSEWEDEAEIELRIFHAAQGEHPTLFRAAKAAENFWIERIVMTGLSNGHWGTVSSESTFRVINFQELEALLDDITSSEVFCDPLTDRERLALDSFTGDSLWMIEVITQKSRAATLMHNIDAVTIDMIDAFKCRDFRKIVDARMLLGEIYKNNSGNQNSSNQ